MKAKVLVTQSCPTFCDPMDSSPPDSFVHGILQARILEWVAISFSMGLPWPRDQTKSPALLADSLLSEPPGKPAHTLLLLLFSQSVVSDSLQPRGLQHARLPCPSPSPGACSNSCPLSRWCHPTISSSVAPFSSCLLSFPAWESFPMSRLFTPGGQNIGASASASVLPMNIQVDVL